MTNDKQVIEKRIDVLMRSIYVDLRTEIIGEFLNDMDSIYSAMLASSYVAVQSNIDEKTMISILQECYANAESGIETVKIMDKLKRK